MRLTRVVLPLSLAVLGLSGCESSQAPTATERTGAERPSALLVCDPNYNPCSEGATDPQIMTTVSGPVSLNAGQTGTYSVTVSNHSGPASDLYYYWLSRDCYPEYYCSDWEVVASGKGMTTFSYYMYAVIWKANLQVHVSETQDGPKLSGKSNWFQIRGPVRFTPEDAGYVYQCAPMVGWYPMDDLKWHTDSLKWQRTSYQRNVCTGARIYSPDTSWVGSGQPQW